MAEQTWRVGHLYNDRATWKKSDDEFLRWCRSGESTIAVAGGVRFRDFTSLNIIDTESGRKIPSFFVLVTSESATQSHNPWDDIVDNVAGNIYYWGDAKYSVRTKHYNDFRGNNRIEATNNLRLSGKLDKLPPFLHFTKPERGEVRFNGLCSLADVSYSWFEDHGQPVKNLRLLLSILDVEHVDTAWLRARAICSDLRAADKLAPEVWRIAKTGRIRKRKVWARQIRTPADQLPVSGSPDEMVLEEIRALKPKQFEHFVVSLIDKIPEIVTGLDHRIIRTQQTGDHGVDFFGHFTMPYPISYQIDFVGEAKRYSAPVTPDKVSRLVARLGRGQYGLFFTTSCFSQRAQEEVIVDRYPVRLFAAQDILKILRAANCIVGTKLRPEWKHAAILPPRGKLSSGLVTTYL